MHSTISAVDLSDKDSEETLVVKEEETYDAGAFEKVEAEVVKRLKEPNSPVKSSSLLVARHSAKRMYSRRHWRSESEVNFFVVLN